MEKKNCAGDGRVSLPNGNVTKLPARRWRLCETATCLYRQLARSLFVLFCDFPKWHLIGKGVYAVRSSSACSARFVPFPQVSTSIFPSSLYLYNFDWESPSYFVEKKIKREFYSAACRTGTCVIKQTKKKLLKNTECTAHGRSSTSTRSAPRGEEDFVSRVAESAVWKWNKGRSHPSCCWRPRSCARHFFFPFFLGVLAFCS